MCFGGNSAMGSGSVSKSQSSSSTSTTKPKPKRRSAGRGSGANKTLKQFGQGVVSKISTDLKMGTATFGMSAADQAAKLNEMGYSKKAIDSYQARTAASKERLKEMMASSNDSDDSSPAPAPKPAVTIGTGSGVGTGGGIPSTTAAIVNQPVETALSYQEQLAQNEIQRARQERTRRKAEALRRRLEGGRRGLSLLRRGGARGYS